MCTNIGLFVEASRSIKMKLRQCARAGHTSARAPVAWPRARTSPSSLPVSTASQRQRLCSLQCACSPTVGDDSLSEHALGVGPIYLGTDQPSWYVPASAPLYIGHRQRPVPRCLVAAWLAFFFCLFVNSSGWLTTKFLLWLLCFHRCHFCLFFVFCLLRWAIGSRVRPALLPERAGGEPPGLPRSSWAVQTRRALQRPRLRLWTYHRPAWQFPPPRPQR